MEYTSTYKDEENVAHVQISEEVITVIAGIAATEVKGVISLAGNIAMELIAKVGIKMLSRGVKIHMMGDAVSVAVTLNIDSNFKIPAVSKAVQEKVSASVETMTGLKVSEVDVMVENVTIRRA